MAFAAIPARLEAHEYRTISVFTTGRVIRADLDNSACDSGDTTQLTCHGYIRRCGNHSQRNDKPLRILPGRLNRSTTTVRRLCNTGDPEHFSTQCRRCVDCIGRPARNARYDYLYSKVQCLYNFVRSPMDASIKKPLAPPAESLLPIRTVSVLTGVNAVTLRAWERRYGLITPKRTPKGHRLYTQQDVDRINQVVKLLNQGISVSHVKPLLDKVPGEVSAATTKDEGEAWKTYQDKMLGALERFDEAALDNLYNDALSLYPVDIVNQRLTTPLLRLLGERWKKREMGIAEEHFFSVYLRNKLGARIHHMNQRAHGPLLLLACLPGELHEIGLLFFALAAVDAGYRVLILGANTPLQQIPGVLARKPCAGVILSGSSKPARGVIETDLPELMSRVVTPVFFGGKTAVSYQETLDQAGVICLDENIATALQLVNKRLKPNKPR